MKHISQVVFTSGSAGPGGVASDGAGPGGRDLVGGTGFVLLCIAHTWHPAWHAIGL